MGYRSNQRNGIAYSEIDITNDRIIAIKVCDSNSNVSQIIICVYMPFFQRGNSRQTDCFIDTVDALQVLVNEHASTAPIKIIGDFNVKLPTQSLLSPGWHRKPGFSPHSAVLYDFILSNDFIVADFLQNQSLDYTYLCDANRTRTWIDHCLCHRRDRDDIISCQIMPLDENLSDHLPIKTSIRFHHKNIPIESNVQHRQRQFAPAKWDNYNNNDLYKCHIQNKLSDLGVLSGMEDLNAHDIQAKLDNYISDLSDIIHASSVAAGCTQQRKYKPKPYWCPNLSVFGGTCGWKMINPELDMYIIVIRV